MSITTENKKAAPSPDTPEAEAVIPPTAPIIEDSSDLDYEALLEAYDTSFKNLAEGEVVSGTVLKLTPSHVIIDVGFKSEGLVSLAEFRQKDGSIQIKPGDAVDVLLESTETSEGGVVLSREKAEQMKIWETIEQAYEEMKPAMTEAVVRSLLASMEQEQEAAP